MRTLLKIQGIKHPYLLTLPAAVFLALSLEPFGFTSAGFLCIFILLILIQRLADLRSWKYATFSTILFSFFVTLTAFHWIWNAIRNISGQGVFLSLLIFLLYACLSFYKIGVVFFGIVFVARFRKIRNSYLFLLVIPSLFLISDWICPMVFPVKWGDLFRNQIFWRQLARFGTEFLGFVSILSVSLIYLMLPEWKKGAKVYLKYLLPILLLLCINIVYLLENIESQNSIHLSLIQPGTKYAKREIQEDHDLMTKTIQSVYNLGVEAIQNSPEPIDLMILPESSIPFLGTLKSENQGSTFSQSFVDITQNLVRLGNLPLAFNELVYDQGSRNSFTLLHPNSLTSDRRYKQLLLPFGEYIPGENRFPFLRYIFPETSNHIPGTQADALSFRTQKGDSVTFSPIICYEILYPELLREMLKNSSSEFIINLTNDSWFESITETEQHAGAGKLRSIELGRPVVRVALGGLTTAYDPWGREMMTELPLNEISIAYLKLPLVSKYKTTPYLQFGSYPWRIICLLLIVYAYLRSPRVG